jgi:hypothetical protein
LTADELEAHAYRIQALPTPQQQHWRNGHFTSPQKKETRHYETDVTQKMSEIQYVAEVPYSQTSDMQGNHRTFM